MAGQIFISHSTHDDALVAKLRSTLEDLGFAAWTDSRELAPGDALDASIARAIQDAAHFLAIISPRAFNSTWMRKEIALAVELEREREGFRAIPLLVAPMEPAALEHFFNDPPLAVTYEPEHDRVDDLLAKLREAFGDARPDDPETTEQPAATPLAELVAEFENLAIDQSGGEYRASAMVKLRWLVPGGKSVESRLFKARSPLGPIEIGELAWYLERYASWPGKIFRARARKVEDALKIWGERLYETLEAESAAPVWEAFRGVPEDMDRCISIRVDPEPPEGSSGEETKASREAATLWLALPWELLHDGNGVLAAGARGTRVRRQIPGREAVAPLPEVAAIRVLVVSPRPEDETAGYIDHRISAKPLVEAFLRLGERAEVELLGEPTLAGLSQALREARAAKRPFHAVHFDGHGVFSRETGLGALCFEDPADREKLKDRRMELVSAEQLAELLREHRVALMVLEACQSAKAEEDPAASVAGRLLEGGVASVVAMSHVVLVATAERFVATFYDHLSRGASVGKAVLEAQTGLREDPSRGRGFHGELRMRDWFVPVLFQEQQDPQLVRELPGKRTGAEILRRLAKAVEGLPDEPSHGFLGRSRELLAIERLLLREKYVVLLGEGGEGKTTLASELARWSVKTRRFGKAAFMSVEEGTAQSAQAVLLGFGQQLVADYVTRSRGDFEIGRQLVERALRDRATILVLDNMESLLDDSLSLGVYEPEILREILALMRGLLEIEGTRVVFTSRTPLPAPFAAHVVRIGRLAKDDAVAMVGRVLGELGLDPEEAEDDDDVEALVDAVNRHARSLVLLAREVGASGVRGATERMSELMEAMQERYPDDRERSLYASVELSLRRLPSGMRERIRGLGVFHGGTHLGVMVAVLGLDYENDEEVVVIKALIDVGLGEMMPYNHLRLHPALGPALLRDLDDAEREQARGAWTAAMVQLTGYLRQQQFKDAKLSAVLTVLELPNLLAALDALHASAEAVTVVDMATSLEGLLEYLGRPQALARVVLVREASAERLGDWSNARFNAESAKIDRLLQAGRFAEAEGLARALVRRAESAGESAYAGAAYDLAMASFRLGRVLRMSGSADAALASLRDARERFSQLAASGDAGAEGMAAVCLAEIGGCLTALGRLEEAAETYEKNIELADGLDDPRQVAVGKGQLGTVRMYQRRYGDALAAHHEAREIFEDLGEPRTVAVAWHQIGMVHQQAGNLDGAEQAYQQSLAIKMRQGDRPGAASTMNQLGNIYSGMGRLEESVRFYRDAASTFAESGDGQNEGRARSNAADDLIRLQRYDEAREEIERAIECKKPFGHTALPWTTFDILHNLEQALGNTAAAAEARERAKAAFRAYRLDGGESHTGAARLVAAVGQAIVGGQVEEMASMLEEIAKAQVQTERDRIFIETLQRVLAGERDPALASDPGLDYDDAVELELLLETLASAES